MADNDGKIDVIQPSNSEDNDGKIFTPPTSDDKRVFSVETDPKWGREVDSDGEVICTLDNEPWSPNPNCTVDALFAATTDDGEEYSLPEECGGPFTLNQRKKIRSHMAETNCTLLEAAKDLKAKGEI